MRLVLSILAATALAASASAQPTCAGQWGVVRVSKIKPGQMPLFRKAVADQQAWYRGHGITDNTQQIGQVVTPAGDFDPSEALTLHLNSPATQPAHDAGWEEFVKEFRASSDMVSEKRVCLTKPG